MVSRIACRLTLIALLAAMVWAGVALYQTLAQLGLSVPDAWIAYVTACAVLLLMMWRVWRL